MPEGHTLHRLARTLDHAFVGTRPRASSPQGRFVEGAARLDGRRVASAQSWGKHLFVTVEGDLVLSVHLGLIGVFDVTRYAGPVPPAVGAVRLRLVNQTHVADLRGATVVELVTPEQMDAVLARLGPDPLRPVGPGNDPEDAFGRITRSGRSIAELLMDQSTLAGVGNVYRCEVLFRHRVKPSCPGRSLRRSTWQALWDDLVDLMPIGVAFGQIITLPDQVDQARELLAAEVERHGSASASGLVAWQGAGEGERGRGRRPAYDSPSPMSREYAVYRRTGQPCLVCGSRVRSMLLAGRTLYWCGRCQRRR